MICNIRVDLCSAVSYIVYNIVIP